MNPAELLPLIKQIVTQLGLGPLVESQLTSALGSNALGLSWLYTDPTKTLGFNKQAQMRQAQMQGMFGGSLASSYAAANQVFATNLYQRLGVPDPVKSAGQPTPITQLLGQALVMPKVYQAYSGMANALYNQQRYYNPGYKGFSYGTDDIGRTERTFSNYKSYGNALIQSVIESATTGEMAGMSVEDSGSVASAYIRAGNLGRAPGQSDLPNRIKRVKAELNDYAASINQLRDVIDGPVEKILEDFEKLAGTSMMSMTRGRVATVATAMQTAMAGGVSKMEIAGATALQMGMIAPFGGSMELANAMGNVTSLGIAGSRPISGLSRGKFAEEMGRMNTRNMANGLYRNAGAAYAAWLGRNEDTVENRQLFLAEMTNGGSRSFNAGASAFLAKKGLLGDVTFMTSALVSNLQNDPLFIAQANADKVVNAFSTGKKSFLSGLLSSGNIRREQYDAIMQATAGVYDPAKMQQALLGVQGINQSSAAFIARGIESVAMQATGSSNGLAALRLVDASQGAVENLRKGMDRATWGIERGKLINGGAGSGVERIIHSMTTTTSNMGFGKLIASFLGLDPDAVNKQLAQKIPLDKIFKQAGVDKEALGSTIQDLAKLGDLGSKLLFAGPTASSTQQKAANATISLIRRLKSGSMSLKDIEDATKDINLDEDTKLELFIQGSRGIDGAAVTAEERESVKRRIEAEKKRFNGKAPVKDVGFEHIGVAAQALRTAKKTWDLAHRGEKFDVTKFREENADVVNRYLRATGEQLDNEKFGSRLSELTQVESVTEWLAKIVDLITTLINAQPANGGK